MKFEQSADTKILITVFDEADVGETVTYEAMSRAIGRDVREHASGAMRSAMRVLRREKNLVFENEPNVGFVRLSDEQIVSSSESDRKRLMRASSRAIEKLTCVRFESLSEDKQREHTVAAAQFGAINLFSKRSASKRIESAVKTSNTPMAIGETLKIFT